MFLISNTLVTIQGDNALCATQLHRIADVISRVTCEVRPYIGHRLSLTRNHVTGVVVKETAIDITKPARLEIRSLFSFWKCEFLELQL